MAVYDDPTTSEYQFSVGLPPRTIEDAKKFFFAVLIAIGVILFFAIGIVIYQEVIAVSANRDAVTNDLMELASRSQQYYCRIQAFGGGGNSFVGITADSAGLAKLTSKSSNANGTYSVLVAGTKTSVVFGGIGVKGSELEVEVVPDTFFVREVRVWEKVWGGY